MSVLRLWVDKGQGLQSGILFFTGLVLPSNKCWDESLKVILVQGFRVACLFTGHYHTKGYDTITDVI